MAGNGNFRWRLWANGSNGASDAFVADVVGIGSVIAAAIVELFGNV